MLEACKTVQPSTSPTGIVSFAFRDRSRDHRANVTRPKGRIGKKWEGDRSMECTDTAGLDLEGAARARRSAPHQPDSLSSERSKPSSPRIGCCFAKSTRCASVRRSPQPAARRRSDTRLSRPCSGPARNTPPPRLARNDRIVKEPAKQGIPRPPWLALGRALPRFAPRFCALLRTPSRKPKPRQKRRADIELVSIGRSFSRIGLASCSIPHLHARAMGRRQRLTLLRRSVRQRPPAHQPDAPARAAGQGRPTPSRVRLVA
jgi:hypothetical protein